MNLPTPLFDRSMVDAVVGVGLIRKPRLVEDITPLNIAMRTMGCGANQLDRIHANAADLYINLPVSGDDAFQAGTGAQVIDEARQMLRDNPNVSIEMGSHTDRKGTDEYNDALSDRRAKSVVDYLVGAGISADRLTWKGYGEHKPKTVTKRINKEYPQFEEGTILTEEFIEKLSPEDQEAADQINRRTEFQVTSITYDFF